MIQYRKTVTRPIKVNTLHTLWNQSEQVLTFAYTGYAMTALFYDTYEALKNKGEPFHRRIPLDVLAKDVRRRNYRDFVEKWKAILVTLREEYVEVIDREDYNYFNELLSLWHKTIASPVFQLEAADTHLFTLNATITNLLALSPYYNSDECIAKILDQPDNLGKLLLLYTPRSGYELPIDKFFEADPMVTSLWYSSVWNWVDSYVSPMVYEKCRRFLEYANPLFEPYDSDLICGYFRCTYVNNQRDRFAKRVFIDSIRRFTSNIAIRNNPNPKSIAVVSAYWNGTHAVYRAFSPYIAELARHYTLTLVDLTQDIPGRKPPVTEHFTHVKNIQADSSAINLIEVADNDFQLVYYPDVGMSQGSMYLASVRLAPIQCMGTGHPVSASSPAMDYFISGGEVETPDNPQDNYDERLVLLPGLSVHPVKPDYKPAFPELPEEFIINCPWMHMKNNMPIFKLLRKILDTASRPVKFSFYPGCYYTGNNSHMTTIKDYSTQLPLESYIVHRSYSYHNYMRSQEQGRFTMHSYPFGGGTTAVDALIMGKPLLIRRGRHEYNRFSAAILKRIGLEELIADTDQEWVDTAVKLIDSPHYLNDITRRIRETDLDQSVFRLEDAGMLKRAFDELIRNHDKIQKDPSRNPIPIG